MTDITLGTNGVLRLEDYADTGLRFGWFASSGAGKGYAVGVCIEEFLDLVYPVVAIDPESELWVFQEVGALVVGGKHQDAPLPWQWEYPPREGRRRPPDPLLHFDDAAVQQAIKYAYAAGGMVVFDLGGRDDQRIESWMLLEEGERLMAVFERVTDRVRKPIVFVAIEASLFAPQQVPGGGRPPESLAGMAQRGRKRGVISIVETQRAQDIQNRAISVANEKFVGHLDDENDYKRLRAYCGNRTYAQMHALPTGHFIRATTGEEVVIRGRRVTHGGGTPAGGGEVQIRQRGRSAIAPEPIIAVLREAAERAVAAPTTTAATPGTGTVTSGEAQRAVDRSEIARLQNRITELERHVDDWKRRAEIDAHEKVVQAQRAHAAEQARDEATRQAELEHDIITDLRVTFAKIMGEGLPVGGYATGGLAHDEVLDLIRQHAPTGYATGVTLAPVEKLRADYLERAAQRLLAGVQALTPLERQVFEFVTAHPAQQGNTSIASGIGRGANGQQVKEVGNTLKRLAELHLIESYRSGNNYFWRPTPDKVLAVADMLKDHAPTDVEVAQVRDRALSLLLAGS